MTICRLRSALPLLFLVGCAAPDSVSLDPDLESPELSRPELGCPFEFDGTSEAFDRRQVQGYWHKGTELENLSGYIDGHIESWLPAAPPKGAPARLQVALYRLNSENKSTATFFNVVLRVSIGNAEPAYLRGRYSSITWFGTPEEFRIKVQRAVNEALTELHRHLEDHCGDAARTDGIGQ